MLYMLWLDEAVHQNASGNISFMQGSNFVSLFSSQKGTCMKDWESIKLLWKHTAPNSYSCNQVHPYWDLKCIFQISIKNNTFEGSFYSDHHCFGRNQYVSQFFMRSLGLRDFPNLEKERQRLVSFSKTKLWTEVHVFWLQLSKSNRQFISLSFQCPLRGGDS